MQPFKKLNFEDQIVLLRVDYDVPLQNRKIADDTRIQASFPTIRKILENKAKQIIILCHIDRPDGKYVEDLSVKPLRKYLQKEFVEHQKLNIHENLRFDPGEEANSLKFAKQLAAQGDLFVNDAFAVSHRIHASIVSLPGLLPSAIGFQFSKEIKALTSVLKNPRPPVVFVIGGAKTETKLPLIAKLGQKADQILLGGKLVQEMEPGSPEIIIAELKPGDMDITQDSAQQFARIIAQAGTVVWNGPMGVFEKQEHSQGTKIIAQAINSSSAYTVIGGGDTEAAATEYNAESEIDHVSMGGGAMLQYLAEGTLPGLEAIAKGKHA